MVVSTIRAPTGLIIGDGADIEVSWTVRNQGPAEGVAPQWRDRVVLSRDNAAGGADDVTLAEFAHDGLLAPNASYSETRTVTLPRNLSGTFFVYVITDAPNVVAEPDGEDNNVSALAPIQVTLPYADLIVEAVVVDPAAARSGDTVAVTWRVRNAGVATTNATAWQDRIYLSADDIFDAGDTELGRLNRSGGLAVQATYSATTAVKLPQGIGGGFHVFVLTDAANTVEEFTFEDNNRGRTLTPIQITRRPDPDLVVTTVTAPTAGQPGRRLSVQFTVNNAGPGEADSPWRDRLYLSPDGTLNGAHLLATATRMESLAAGQSYDVTLEFVVPLVADGGYRLLVVTDESNSVFEGDAGSAGETNNLRAADEPIVIGHPDLRVAIDTAPTTATSGDTVPLVWTVTNRGSAAAESNWVDRVYLSADADFNAQTDRLLATREHAGPLAASASLSVQLDVVLPLDAFGAQFILVVTDAANALNEVGDEGNNVANVPITISLAPFADLAVSNVTAPPLTIGDPVQVTIGWTVTNTGTGRGRTDRWVDRIVASRNATPGDSDDVVLAEFEHRGGLDVDASYTESRTVRLPPGFQGRYHLFVLTDAGGVVFENDREANNAAEAPNVFDVVRLPFADLVVTQVQPAATGGSGLPLTISWRVENNAANAVGETNISEWSDTVSLARNADGSNVVITLGSFNHVGVLKPGDGYDRTVQATLPNGISGTFFIVVTTGGPFEHVYTDNNLRVSGPVEVALTPAPDLTVTEITGPPTSVAGGRIDVTWTVRNAGTGDAFGTWQDAVLLREVGGTQVIPLGAFHYVSEPTGLPAGRSYTRREQFTLPINVQGLFQVEVETNRSGSLFELGATANNTARDDETMLITLPPRPDLQVQQVIAPAQASAGGTVTLEFIVINQGTVATATPRWKDNVYLSLDDQISGDDLSIGSFDNGSALEPGGQYRTVTGSLEIPRRFRGPVFLIVRADAHGQIDEFPNEGNNTQAVEINILPLPPADLVTSDVVAPTQAFDDSTIEVRYKVTNLGSGETDRDQWTDTVWLTRDKNRPSPVRRVGDEFAIEDYLLGSIVHSGSLAVGQSYEAVVNVRLPANVTGEWHITPWSDAYDVITEDTLDVNINPDDPNELDNNNYKARPITIVLRPPPDLIVESVVPQAVGFGGQPFTVQWTVKNIGQSPTQETQWIDRVYLSKTPDLTGPHLLLGEIRRSVALGPEATYTASATFDLTPAAAGQFVIVVTGEGVFEGPFVDNNANFAPTNVTNAPADFIVTSVVTPAENFSGEPALIEYSVRNQGPAVWSGTRYWQDEVWISPDPEFIPARATQLGVVTHSNADGLGSGASYTVSKEFVLPRGIGGEFFIYVFTNVGGTQADASGRNDLSRDTFISRAFEATSNNQGAAPIAVTYREPDLVVSALDVGSNPIQAGGRSQVMFTVTNQGNRATREAYWIDRVYLSRDPSLDKGDQLIGAAEHRGVLGVGASYTTTVNVVLPDGIVGDFFVLVFVDSNLAGPLPPAEAQVGFEDRIDKVFARVPEFQGEGNNITSAPLQVLLANPPDLRVSDIRIPVRVAVGQPFDVTWTVTNVGTGPTSDKTPEWLDLVFLSRDTWLDLSADHFLRLESHREPDGVLLPGEHYTVTVTVRPPPHLVGPFYVFVVTDPARPNEPRGKVHEGPFETNNAAASDDPLILELPPPSDLQVQEVLIPAQAKSGQEIEVSWRVKNFGPNTASGAWTDALYLSTDEVWDIHDRPLGRETFTGTLAPDEEYTLRRRLTLPPATPGRYRVIVRADIFNELYEAQNEANNQTPSGATMELTVERLQLGVPFVTRLSTGQEQLFEVDVELGQTLHTSVSSRATDAAHELFVRYAEVPTAVVFDAAYIGPLAPNQTALVPSTQPGRYYLLVRAHSEPAPNSEVTVLAKVLPLMITNVIPDVGGDSRYVTTTIRGAQFHEDAVVKLVRPGIAEFEPVRYEVLDSTKIVAIFDLRDAPHGLYDVSVINPDGQRAVVPYRYLIERALEPDVSIGLGGPRVLSPGQTGFYGVSVRSDTNVDTPYTYFTFGIPELGTNPNVFGLPYVTFASNLRGAPERGDWSDVPFASLVSDINTSGEILAPGYVFDLATRSFAGRTFSVQVYRGLAEILAANPKALEGIEDDEIAFQFHLVAAATSLTRAEFIAQQTVEALKLRDAILADQTASQALVVLAADADTWTTLYLASLEEAGFLRPEDQAPPIRETPLVVSLTSVLATGILAGPAGDRIITDGNLVHFFEKVREWYGHDPELIGSADFPSLEDYDLGTSRRTHFETFGVFVPYGKLRLDIPPGGPITPVQFASFLQGTAAGVARLATMTGPFGFGSEQFVPLGTPLPYAIYFENPSTANGYVSQIRIVTPLDGDLDPRRFRLGDLRVGPIAIHLPESRGAFAGEFDFSQQLGFIVRVSAGLDIASNTASWLIQAIDPFTGEVVTDPNVGLLAPNDAEGRGTGFVTFTTQPLATAPTGAIIEASARVLFNNLAPEDTETLVHVLDATAPTTTLTATPLAAGGSDYLLEWRATDDDTGSGVKGVTVYVATDGGDFKILLSQTQETAFVFQGEAGHTYEFIALATDNAGNRERPPRGIAAPDDGSRPDLGALPEVEATTQQDLSGLQPPPPTPSTNPLFIEAKRQVPNTPPARRSSEFATVFRPFVANSFATGIPTSFAAIGPMAIVVFPDQTVLASGGANRGSLFRFGLEGGAAADPIATLPYPVFDMALAADGTIWATTGGGPLLHLEAQTGAILGEFGDGITQSVAIHPTTGRLYLSSSTGIEVFDPATGVFTHLSDLRVGSLAFSPSGELWAAVWPNRGEVVRLDSRAQPEVMLRLDSPVDSLTFGQTGTLLENLLFISNNARPGDKLGEIIGGELVMVDLATLDRVIIARGGTRGDIVEATADGRVLLSQSNQIDVISPILAPRVAQTNPPADAIVALPRGFITVTFDQDMKTGDAADPASVLNPANYRLTGEAGGAVPVREVRYDAPSRTVSLLFDAFVPDRYTLEVLATIQSGRDVPLAEPFTAQFLAVSDFSAFVRFAFFNSRMLRSAGTISYDVTLTNVTTHDLVLPLVLILDPAQHYHGVPEGALPQDDTGVFFIDLSGSLPEQGRLRPNQTTLARTVTLLNPDGQHVDLGHGFGTLPAPNQAPRFTSTPVTTATVGQQYSYTAQATDPDGIALIYVLVQGPRGMAIDPASGVVTWTPEVTDPAQPTVILHAYDARGGFGRQEFTIAVAGVNRPPVFVPLPARIAGFEGQPVSLAFSASDPEGQPLVFWGDHLPPGAAVDPVTGQFLWTPGFDAAGTYEDVRLFASDGVNDVSAVVTLLIEPVNQAPNVVRPPDRTILEGQTLRFAIAASDPEGDAIRFSSALLPANATLHPLTGVFEWTPAYFQAGVHEIPFTVSDGKGATTKTTVITVLNVNAAPVFDPFFAFRVAEGQSLQFKAFAFDPDNPGYVPPDRLQDGSLTLLEGSNPSVTYTVEDLPAGASFDDDTTAFTWTPNFAQAGTYNVTFIATDDGNGTGTPAVTRATVPIIVSNINRPPVIPDIPNQTVARGEVLALPIAVIDPDGDPITLSATSALEGFPLPGFMTFTDQGGGHAVLRVAPGFNDRGDYPVVIRAVDDGDGGGDAAVQRTEFTFNITVTAPNEPPVLAFIGPKVAVVGEPLTFDVTFTDKDEDPVTVALLNAPPGATFTHTAVYGVARFQWTPTEADLAGSPYTVTLRVTDSGQGTPAEALSDEETITLTVRRTNSPPVLLPVGDQTITELQDYTLSLRAFDADGDVLTFAAANLPPRAQFDPVAGRLTWTPGLLQAGVYRHVTFSVTDGAGTSSETVTLTVHNLNQPPVLVPLARQSGREGTPLQFTLAAGDLDGDALRFSAGPLPEGARFDPETRQFQWTPGFEQAGTYVLRFTVTDSAHLTDSTDVQVHIDNVNRPPTLEVTPHAAALGQRLSFRLRGVDPDLNTTLTYAATGLPAGATLDPATGEFMWTPGPGQAGDYVVGFSVSDGEAITRRAVLIRASINPHPPAVAIELTPGFPATPGQRVSIHAIADSLSDITSLVVTVDGQALPINERGQVQFLPSAPGHYLVEAVATDADGLVGRATRVLKVRDPNDADGPTVAFAPGVDGALLRTATDLLVSVADVNLDEWRLEIAAKDSDAFRTLAGGTAPVANAAVTTLDPATLPNGFYVLRLTATDISGRTRRAEILFEVNTSDKASRYYRPEVDLAFDFGGVNFTLTRAYDSLARQTPGTFGFGWSWTERDVAIQTNVPSTGREALGAFNPFRLGTRLYLTLPDGRRVGFTFAPQKTELPGLTYYTPVWIADAGVNYTLSSVETKLTLAGDRFYDLKTAQPYNPASGLFAGPEYTLTAPDGTAYDLSTALGVVQRRAPNGTRLVYTSNGVVNPQTRDVLEFVRDAMGRVREAVAPDGTKVVYTYDEAGNLASARNLATATSFRYGYARETPHWLQLAIAPNAADSRVVLYQPALQVLPVTGYLGTALQFTGTTTNANLVAGATERYALVLRGSEISSTPMGQVLVGIEWRAADGSGVKPAPPQLVGRAPLVTQTTAEGSFALFALDTEGLALLELTGRDAASAGAYTLRVEISGDVNADGKVDGVDAQQVLAALGTSTGDPGFVAAADADRNGRIEPADVQLLGSNFGFLANRPPVTTNGAALTHVDLDVVVPLASLATDPEDDPVFFRVINPANGSVQLRGDGTAVIFRPTPGFSGEAQFEVIADDGFASSAPARAGVTVSNAPLVRLDFVFRNPQVPIGQSAPLILQGDFADQGGVLLPASYLTFTSSDETIGRVNALGQLSGLATGTGVVSAQRGGLTATTAFVVGNPPLTENIQLVTGLDIFPTAITLVPGSTRKLLVTINAKDDVTSAASGTLYRVDDPTVAQVSADGLITALAPGRALVTAIHKGAERVVPVLVETPRIGRVEVGLAGGAVQASDGAVVAVAPGALSRPTTVSLTPLTEAELPMALPTRTTFVGAYHLDLGGELMLDVPAQMKVPVPQSLRPGTGVFFFRYAEIPNAQGEMEPIWMQDEIGTVGADGFAYTSSPPFPGVQPAGVYAISAFDPGPGGVSLYKGKITATFPIAAVPIATFGIDNPPIKIGIAAAFVAVTWDVSRLEIVALTPEGLPVVTPAGVEIDPTTGIAEYRTTLTPPPLRPEEPFLESVRLVFEDGEPIVVLSGQHLKDAPPGAIGQSTVEVTFRVGDRSEKGQIVSNTDTEARVRIPASVPVSLADIRLIRTDTVLRQVGSLFVPTTRTRTSPAIRLTPEGRFVFAALKDRDQVAVMTQGDPTNPQPETTINLVARIPVGDGPRSVAVTNDLSRAYTANLNDGTLSVIDALALREVDLLPDDPNVPGSEGVNRIKLPTGARPFWIVIDAFDRFAYLGDEVLGAIYVVDINPASPDYHQHVKTITVSPTPPGLGLRGLAISSDGKKLYAAGPNRNLLGTKQADQSRIFVVNIDPDDRPADVNGGPNPKKYWEQIGAIESDQETYGITATPRADKMLFVNRLDATGFGVLTVTNPDPIKFSASVAYTGLHLGSNQDYFDVNNANAVVMLPDASYAFVSTFNKFIQGVPGHDPNDGDVPAGSNVGIIKDPLGNPQLVAATRPIPVSFADNLALSSDARYLYVGMRTLGSVFVYDVQEMLAELHAAQARGAALDRRPLNDHTGGVRSDEVGNVKIDVRADFRIIESRPAAGFYRFGVPTDSTHGPIVTGGLPQGLVAQSDWLKLIAPLGPGQANTGLEFSWDFGGVEVRTVSLYLSVKPPGEGLFPWDPLPLDILQAYGFDDPALAQAQFTNNGDPNPGRILAKHWDTPETSYRLEDLQALTKSQRYYWGVEAIATDGRRKVRTGSFVTQPQDAAPGGFSSVTLITHGWSIAYADVVPAQDFIELAKSIADSNAGSVFQYHPSDGTWFHVHGPASTPNDAVGRPLVLVSDWVLESGISDSGFAEAAADALFAGLVQLNEDTNGKVFASPLHLIGFSRGTPVTTEISQRIGTYFSPAADVHVTTLDPHDFRQDLLNVPMGEMLQTAQKMIRGAQLFLNLLSTASSLLPGVGPVLEPFVLVGNSLAQYVLKLARNLVLYAQSVIDQYGLDRVRFDDFLDPDVQVWEHEDFHDNYWQNRAPTGMQGFNLLTFSATPNGRPLTQPLAGDHPDYTSLNTQAQLDLNLNLRPGWTEDDSPLRFMLEGWINSLAEALRERAANLPFASGALRGFINHLQQQALNAAAALQVGLGSPHFRVKPWYAGTTNLALDSFPSPAAAFLGSGEEIWRMPLDSLYRPYQGVYAPWYRAQEPTPGQLIDALNVMDNRSWEGIGTGWFYSTLGGGNDFRPTSSPAGKRPLSFDNTEDVGWDGPVPSVYNGNFEASIHAVYGRFPQRLTLTGALASALPAWLTAAFPKGLTDLGPGIGTGTQIPGWSFKGGGGGTHPESHDQGEMLLELIAIDQLASFGITDPSVIAALDKYFGDRYVDLDQAIAASGIHPITDAFVQQIVQAIQDGRINRVVKLDPVRAFLRHNRLYVPEDVSQLAFDLAVLAPGADLQVTFTLQNGNAHTINLAINQASAPRKNRVAVPDSVKGKVATIEFRLTGGGVVLLDNVQFDGLIITDDSEDPDDGLILMTENNPDMLPPLGPDSPEPPDGLNDPNEKNDDGGSDGTTPRLTLPPITLRDLGAVVGEDLHTITIKNSTSDPREVAVYVLPNHFLVYLPDGVPGSNEQLFNDVTPAEGQRQLGIFTLLGNQELRLKFLGRLPPNYLADQHGEKEVELLSATVAVYTTRSGVPANLSGFRDETTVFYLVDGADDSAFDKKIKFADTLGGLTGTTRSISVALPKGVTLRATTTQNAGGRFEVGAGRNSNTAEIRLIAKPINDGAPAQLAEGELYFSFQGKELNPNSPIKLVARSTPRHVLNISLKDLEDAVKQVFTLPDPTGRYTNFKNILVDPFQSSAAFDANFAVFVQAFTDAINQVYRESGQVSDFELGINFLDGTGGDVTFNTTAAKTSKGTTPTRKVGWYWTTYQEWFFSVEYLIQTKDDQFTLLSPANYLSVAQLRFLIDQIINPQRHSGFTLFVHNLASYVEASDSLADIGRSFGKTTAHEFGHNIGLLDEYQRNPADRKLIPNQHLFGQPTFMSTGVSLNVFPQHVSTFGLAFNLPDRNLPLTEAAVNDFIYDFWRKANANQEALYPNSGQRTIEGDGFTLLTATESGLAAEQLTNELLIRTGLGPSTALTLWSRLLGRDVAMEIDLVFDDLPADAISASRIWSVDALGVPTRGVITIDPTANGLGWFLDPTPFDNEEFVPADGNFTWSARPGSVAAGHYDLLTALAHEVGHLLGFSTSVPTFTRHVEGDAGTLRWLGPDATAVLASDGQHLSEAAHPFDLMNASLEPSVRRLPSVLDARILAATLNPWAALAGPGRGRVGGAGVSEGLRTSAPADASLPSVRVLPKPVDLHFAAPPAYSVLSRPPTRAEAGPPQPSEPSARRHALTPVALGAPVGNLQNGSFSVADRTSPKFGWTPRGDFGVVNGQGRFGEANVLLAGLSQTFVVPQGARALRFTIHNATLQTSPLTPPDAFEVALLDTATMEPLVGSAEGLNRTDALFNLQPDGKVYFALGVSVSGARRSGDTVALNAPILVEVDLASVAAGTVVTLSFDLLGFGADNSQVVIDDVQIVTEATAPGLSFRLDPATDSGTVGDDLTNFARVNLIGSTDPLQEVLLDLDGDGFDDGSVAADAAGQFVFTNVPLIEGANNVRLQATNPQGTTTRERTITLDTVAPTIRQVVINGGELQRSKVTTIDIHFSEEVTASLSGADLLLRNLTADNTIDPASLVVRFDAATNTATWTFPDLTGGSLPDGNYRATLLAVGVFDTAGNALDSDGNGASGDDFTFDFFRYYGDLDADRDVDFFDLYGFQQTYLKTASAPEYRASLDYDADGEVGATDLEAYRAHYFTVLAPP